jgi:hypothetical protein
MLAACDPLFPVVDATGFTLWTSIPGKPYDFVGF